MGKFKINKFIPLLVALILFNSCSGFLDSESPSIITEKDFWQNPSDAKQGVASIYDAAQSTFEYGFWNYSEFRSDNFDLVKNANASWVQVDTNNLTVNTTGNNWKSYYTAIATANLAIQNIEKMTAFNDKDNLLAQAYALRAFFYFGAVRIWGNIPKVVKPTTNRNENIKRSPKSEIFSDIIIPDLQKSEQLIHDKRNLNHISLGAILALKAHVYMWPGNHQDYSVARDAITQMEILGYSLETTESGWIDIFRGDPQNSSEIIFALSWNYDQDGSNGVISEITHLDTEWIVSEDMRQSWSTESGDFRRDASFSDKDEHPSNDDWYFYKKYAGDFDDLISMGNWSSLNDRDLILYRFSGLLLLKAEAENYLGNPKKALTLINKIRTARGLAQVDETITNKSTIKEIVLEERRFELVAEGKRFWDLVRNGVALDILGSNFGLNDPKKIYWPVAQEVLNRNSAIDQTDGY